MMWTWQKTVSAAVGITAIYGLAATFDAPVPKPAWASQVEKLKAELKSELESSRIKLAGDIKSVRMLTLERAVESDEIRWAQLKGEAQKYRDNGEPVPDFLSAQITALERRIRSREAELEALR